MVAAPLLWNVCVVVSPAACMNVLLVKLLTTTPLVTCRLSALIDVLLTSAFTVAVPALCIMPLLVTVANTASPEACMVVLLTSAFTMAVAPMFKPAVVAI